MARVRTALPSLGLRPGRSRSATNGAAKCATIRRRAIQLTSDPRGIQEGSTSPNASAQTVRRGVNSDELRVGQKTTKPVRASMPRPIQDDRGVAGVTMNVIYALPPVKGADGAEFTAV